MAEQIGRKIIRLADSIVNLAVLLILLLFALFAIFAMWDSAQVYERASATRYAVYKPNAEDSLSFDELRALNPEVFAWLTVYGTHIDYPVTQGGDNQKYVNTNVYGEYELSGSIFLDYRNSLDFQDFNNILYGHHMEKNAMFGEVGSFGGKTFFDEHPYGSLFYDGQDYGLVFFAFLHTDAYDKATFNPRVAGQAAEEAYLQRLLAKASLTRDIAIGPGDRILLLTTCASEQTNGRDILAAKITDERYADTFDTFTTLKSTDEPGSHAAVDRQQSVWASIPLWAKITAPTLLLLLLPTVLYIRKRNGE